MTSFRQPIRASLSAVVRPDRRHFVTRTASGIIRVADFENGSEQQDVTSASILVLIGHFAHFHFQKQKNCACSIGNGADHGSTTIVVVSLIPMRPYQGS